MTNDTSDKAEPNREQATYWNEQAGPRWAALQRDLDVQLEPFGVAVARTLALASGDMVLDVGCGAGATSVMLADRVRPGKVVGIDISGPLLARARERASGMDNVRFERADAQTFPFADGAYDAVFSRFGVMFFDDPVAAFGNLRTALRPNGKLGFVCWRPVAENPWFAVPLGAARPFLPSIPQPPEPGAPGPFAFADKNRVRNILEHAGYGDIEIAPHDIDIVFGGRSDLDGAVDVALQVGALGRVAQGLPDDTTARIRAAVRESFLPHHRPAGVVLRSATWIVSARQRVTGTT